jgi:outer membrane protein
MKHFSTILSAIAILFSGIALFKQFAGNGNTAKPAQKAEDPKEATPSFKMAYFDMDSLQNNYEYFKDALGELKAKEQNMNNELASLERGYQKKIADWQQRGNTMSQNEAEAAQREYQQMQQTYQQRRETLEQQLVNQQIEYKKSIKGKIEDFLKEYNKDSRFAYILSYEPQLMFYKDSVYDITQDLVKGLNAQYKKK